MPQLIYAPDELAAYQPKAFCSDSFGCSRKPGATRTMKSQHIQRVTEGINGAFTSDDTYDQGAVGNRVFIKISRLRASAILRSCLTRDSDSG